MLKIHKQLYKVASALVIQMRTKKLGSKSFYMLETCQDLNFQIAFIKKKCNLPNMY